MLRSSPTKLSELWWQQNNARPHTAAHTTAFLEWRGVTVVRQPYSPDLNACDRWLFKHSKKHSRKMKFTAVDEIRDEALRCFRQIPRSRFELLFNQTVITLFKNIQFVTWNYFFVVKTKFSKLFRQQ